MHSLSWLPTLWRNRDPLVRAAAHQLLAGLVSHPRTATQLVNSIVMAPSDLCHTLLTCIIDTDECCIVKEQACIALGNLTRSCTLVNQQYVSLVLLLFGISPIGILNCFILSVLLCYKPLPSITLIRLHVLLITVRHAEARGNSDLHGAEQRLRGNGQPVWLSAPRAKPQSPSEAILVGTRLVHLAAQSNQQSVRQRGCSQSG